MGSRKRVSGAAALVLGAAALMMSGCCCNNCVRGAGSSGAGTGDQRNAGAEGQKSMADLKAEIERLRNKIKAVTDDQQECLRKCREAYEAAEAACDTIEDPSRRLECLRAAMKRWIECTDGCIVKSP